MRQQQAEALAKNAGEAALTAARKGEDKLTWGNAMNVSRLDPRPLPPMAVGEIFKIDAGKLPGYAGVAIPGRGYSVFKVTKVDAGETMDNARRQAMRDQLANLAMQEEVQLYLDALKARLKVEINEKALTAK